MINERTLSTTRDCDFCYAFTESVCGIHLDFAPLVWLILTLERPKYQQDKIEKKKKITKVCSGVSMPFSIRSSFRWTLSSFSLSLTQVASFMWALKYFKLPIKVEVPKLVWFMEWQSHRILTQGGEWSRSTVPTMLHGRLHFSEFQCLLSLVYRWIKTKYL